MKGRKKTKTKESFTRDEEDAFLTAAEHGDIKTLKKFITAGISVNVEDETGLTPLHYAIIGKSLSAMILLLDHGALTDAADETGLTPLHLAIIKGNRDAIELLIDAGASIEAVDHIGYSALLFAKLQGTLPYKETEELLIKNSPESLFYKNEFLHRKLLAHAFASQATQDLILFKTKGQIVKTIAGFPPGDYFLAKIHESLTLFFEEYSDRLDSTTKELLLSASELSQNETPQASSEELYRKWLSGKPILLASGFIGHHVSVCIWEDHLIITNRGNGNEGKQVRLAKFNSTLMTESIIQTIQELEQQGIESYLYYMHDHLPDDLEFSRSSVESALEDYLNETILPQDAPNCAWSNRQGALQALLQLHFLKEENVSLVDDQSKFYESLRKAGQIFSLISTFQKCLFVEKYLDPQENPEHPNYPSPQLLNDAAIALKSGMTTDFPNLKQKLLSTLNRLERFFETLQSYSSESPDSDVQTAWENELSAVNMHRCR